MCIQCLLCTRNSLAHSVFYLILSTLQSGHYNQSHFTDVETQIISCFRQLSCVPQNPLPILSTFFMLQETTLYGQDSRWGQPIGEPCKRPEAGARVRPGFIPSSHVVSHWLCSSTKCHRSSECGPDYTAFSFLLPETNFFPLPFRFRKRNTSSVPMTEIQHQLSLFPCKMLTLLNQAPYDSATKLSYIEQSRNAGKGWESGIQNPTI